LVLGVGARLTALNEKPASLKEAIRINGHGIIIGLPTSMSAQLPIRLIPANR
jgi:hypothetical protein